MRGSIFKKFLEWQTWQKSPRRSTVRTTRKPKPHKRTFPKAKRTRIRRQKEIKRNQYQNVTEVQTKRRWYIIYAVMALSCGWVLYQIVQSLRLVEW